MKPLYLFNNRNINIIHFHGKTFNQYKKTIQRLLKNKIEYKDSFGILSIWTDDNKCLLYQQLKNSGIEIKNALENINIDHWYMPDKIKYFSNALRQMDNEIVLILDGYDVLINNFDNMLETFKGFNCKILYNGSVNNFPNIEVDKELWQDYPKYKQSHFNAGCCIGYREDLIKFYDECSKYIEELRDSNKWNSEQYVMRTVFAKNHLGKDNLIKIDVDNKIFCTMIYTRIYKTEDGQYKIRLRKENDNIDQIDSADNFTWPSFIKNHSTNQ